MRNTNSSIEQSLERVGEIQELCLIHGKQLVVYISMGFGNPYGDTWNVQIVEEWVSKLEELGITIISLSDTIGVSTPESISYLFSNSNSFFSYNTIIGCIIIVCKTKVIAFRPRKN